MKLPVAPIIVRSWCLTQTATAKRKLVTCQPNDIINNCPPFPVSECWISSREHFVPETQNLSMKLSITVLGHATHVNVSAPLEES